MDAFSTGCLILFLILIIVFLLSHLKQLLVYGLIIGAIITIILAFEYFILSLIAFLLIVGIWTWIKLGYDKSKKWLYNRKHYRNGIYKP